MGAPSKIVLTLDLKLKMGAFKCLPPELRRELEDQARQTGPGFARASREAAHF
jgi:hypothetical protein